MEVSAGSTGCVPVHHTVCASAALVVTLRCTGVSVGMSDGVCGARVQWLRTRGRLEWEGGEVAGWGGGGVESEEWESGRWVFTPWNMFSPGARWDAKKTAGLPLTRAEINN